VSEGVVEECPHGVPLTHSAGRVGTVPPGNRVPAYGRQADETIPKPYFFDVERSNNFPKTLEERRLKRGRQGGRTSGSEKIRCE